MCGCVYVIWGVSQWQGKWVGRPGYCSIWSYLHSIILWLSAPNKGYEFCFLKAGYKNPRGPCSAGVVPGVNVCVQGRVCLSLAMHVNVCACVYVCANTTLRRCVCVCVSGPEWKRTPLIALSSLWALFQARPTLSGGLLKDDMPRLSTCAPLSPEVGEISCKPFH